jgi:hypothetical protein
VYALPPKKPTPFSIDDILQQQQQEHQLHRQQQQQQQQQQLQFQLQQKNLLDGLSLLSSGSLNMVIVLLRLKCGLHFQRTKSYLLLFNLNQTNVSNKFYCNNAKKQVPFRLYVFLYEKTSLINTELHTKLKLSRAK